MEKNVKISRGSILFYVFAVIFLVIAAYNIYGAYDYIAKYKEAASTTPALSDVVKLYIDYAAPYFAYSIISYGIGMVIRKLGDLTGALSICVEDAMPELSEDTFDAEPEHTESAVEEATEKPAE